MLCGALEPWGAQTTIHFIHSLRNFRNSLVRYAHSFVSTSMSKTAKSELIIYFLSLKAEIKLVAQADEGGSFNEKTAEPSAPDPYEEFLKGQRQREATWRAERAAKYAGVNSPPVETIQRGKCQKTVELDKVKKTANEQPRHSRKSVFLDPVRSRFS